MYCIKCGVELSDGQKKCPLCMTEVYHPDFVSNDSKGTFPKAPPPQVYNKWGVLFVVTALFVLAISIVLICDLAMHKSIMWSGYVVLAILLGYTVFVLPSWFRRPNPVIFVPCDFAAALIFLFYLNYRLEGNWFLTFACPVVLVACAITTAVVTLNKYVPRGFLYTMGGAFIAMGLSTVLLEYLIGITFYGPAYFIWSYYPVSVFILLGIMMLIVAICKPLRRSLERIFFI